MTKIILPKTLKTEDPRYIHLNGKPKLSYSQYSSWINSEYHHDYIKQYFIGLILPNNVYAEAGSDAGTYIEWKGMGQDPYKKPQPIVLNKTDYEILDTIIDYPENAIYEDYIVVDCGYFVIEGFADRIEYIPNKGVKILDYKTGSIKKKTADYASEDYGQTTLYAYQRHLEGYDILDSEVFLIDRSGNNTPKYPIKLTGEYKRIQTPFSIERAEKLIKNIKKTADEISERYQVYLKYFTD